MPVRPFGIVGMTVCAITLAGLATAGCQAEHGDLAASPAAMDAGYSSRGYDVRRLDEARLKELARDLSREEERVILRKGTEPSFTGDLLENKADGIYVCRLCGLPLFSSEGKFISGTGWPSFFATFDPAHVATESDTTLGMTRTEILCARCDGHLGHVFDDGPEPTGLRYCVNSASLDFCGVDERLPPRSRPIETAYFAGGCFWGVEDRFQQVPGVLDAVSGYQGGTVANPTYRQVCSGRTGHAESVRVVFDPSKVSYEQLLDWFFRFHDPTQRDRQGPDYGSQYRSAIFTANERQLAAARDFVDRQQRSGRFGSRRIATQIRPADVFYAAEEYHQDYHLKHGGSCPLPN